MFDEGYHCFSFDKLYLELFVWEKSDMGILKDGESKREAHSSLGSSVLRCVGTSTQPALACFGKECKNRGQLELAVQAGRLNRHGNTRKGQPGFHPSLSGAWKHTAGSARFTT